MSRATALLVGSEDEALAAMLAELLAGVGVHLIGPGGGTLADGAATPAAEGAASCHLGRTRRDDTDLLLLVLDDALAAASWGALEAACARGRPVIVLLPFYDGHVAARAHAAGALACHGLDQPLAKLSAAVDDLLRGAPVTPRPAARACSRRNP